MKTKWILLLLISTFALVSCRHRPPQPPPDAHAHDTHKTALELNNGKKWVVPGPMMVHIHALETAVHNFESSPNRDHSSLALTIQDNLGKLVTNCTMKGQAHDELHKWLMPLLGISAEYVQAAEPDLQAQKYHEIQHALVVFNDYFE